MKTIAPRVIGLVLVTALFPALLVIALALDLVRWTTRRVPLVATRLLCFSWVYLAAEGRRSARAANHTRNHSSAQHGDPEHGQSDGRRCMMTSA